MPLDRFLVAPYQTGLQNDMSPWMIPDDAFDELNNAYVYHGRIRKRFGTTLLNGETALNRQQLTSRLRTSIGITDGNGDIAGSIVNATYNRIGQIFSIGDTIFTINQLGAAAMLSTGPGTGTYNTATGAFSITGAPATTEVFFYISEPVMGLTTYERATTNDEQYFAFDTRFAYRWSGTEWIDTTVTSWTGTDSDFFQATNWNGANSDDYLLFVTNYVAADQIKYWNNVTWTTINPQFNAAGATIETARIILPFKDRLVLLNIIESVGTFRNRCRFSQNGSPLSADAFREDIPGRGGYIDAPTKESIVSAEFLRDRLIVFFERSTWELVYTGNEVLPFRWQKINTELGVESTFSVVPFDKAVLGIGNVGIHACNGINVERIDEKIHDDVFKIHNNNEGVFRVCGIRDYRTQLVYWSFPSIDSAQENLKFPNRVLVYNYENGSWAYNDDSFTAFGYFQNQTNITWEQLKIAWQDYAKPWNEGSIQARDLRVIAGNQEGFTFIIDADVSTNAPSLQITDISGTLITAINHNLVDGDFIQIENTEGVTGVDGIWQVLDTTTDTITILGSAVGTYTGGGTIRRLSQIDMRTKQFNFYVKDGRNFTVQRVDFQVDRTSNGQITVDQMPSSTDLSLIEEGIFSDAILGNGVLETFAYPDIPLEQMQHRLWHPVYMQAQGEFIQLRIYLNDEQMRIENIVNSPFEMHAMLFYVQPTSVRLQ